MECFNSKPYYNNNNNNSDGNKLPTTGKRMKINEASQTTRDVWNMIAKRRM